MRRIKLVIDFDETITKFDTLNNLAHTIFTNATGIQEQARLQIWEAAKAVYYASFNSFCEQRLESLRKIANDKTQFNTNCKSGVETITSIIDVPTDVEESGMKLVQKEGILSGISRDLIRTSAAQILCKDKFPQILQKLSPFLFNHTAYVLSANWSRDWIHGCISHYNLDNIIKEENVLCNDLEYDPNTQLSTGYLQKSVIRPCDKRFHIQKLRLSCNSNNNTDAVLIYVGDSSHDLPALLESDIGIVIGNPLKPSLTEICKHIDVQIISDSDIYLENYRQTKANTIKTHLALFHAKDWDDICELIQKIK